MKGSPQKIDGLRSLGMDTPALTVSARCPAIGYTARVIPQNPQVKVPLKTARIPGQR
jgi:hypothetical protein